MEFDQKSVDYIVQNFKINSRTNSAWIYEEIERRKKLY